MSWSIPDTRTPQQKYDEQLDNLRREVAIRRDALARAEQRLAELMRKGRPQ